MISECIRLGFPDVEGDELREQAFADRHILLRCPGETVMLDSDPEGNFDHFLGTTIDG